MINKNRDEKGLRSRKWSFSEIPFIGVSALLASLIMAQRLVEGEESETFGRNEGVEAPGYARTARAS